MIYTITDLKYFVSESVDNVNLSYAVSSSIDYVESYCNRKFTSGSYTEYIDGNDDTELHLNNKNILSITSIEYFDGIDTFDDLFSDTDYTVSDVIIDNNLNFIRLVGDLVFPAGNRNIKIIYVSGYDNSNIPFDIKRVMNEYGAMVYWNTQQNDSSRLGLRGKNLGFQASEGQTFGYDFERWEKILDKYKIYWI